MVNATAGQCPEICLACSRGDLTAPVDRVSLFWDRLLSLVLAGRALPERGAHSGAMEERGRPPAAPALSQAGKGLQEPPWDSGLGRAVPRGQRRQTMGRARVCQFTGEQHGRDSRSS